ncbi:uncharacterized protein B0H64DRAFT_437984 [Chaetomium fimeti]|uniref:NAD(P)-binding domain-containing protein n=1 Tax=Chaetomium fimeti TaxID=1854472 RepID=A0AAE0LX65_9PEZI|nr:hypothetical protein B0H64DRAFT_437984 [Chaetomium fimeti]
MSSSSQPAILVLGGTGTVGSRIVSQLAASSHPHRILVASRNGSKNNDSANPRVQHVPFDWHDTDTWDNLFPTTTTANTANPTTNTNITAVYLIAPPTLGAEQVMIDFVELARGRGVRRFVLQSGSPIEAGGPAMGQVHAHLRDLGQRGEAEWACLRPTWFQQNFADQSNHVQSIKEESKVYSATGDAKLPWVSADDIAAVAVRTLTDKVAPNGEYLVLGSELLSYGEIANILSEVLGRKIVHVDLSSAELEQRYQSFGMPEDYAKMMGALDTSVKFGSENRTNDVILAVTGSAPRKFKDFALSVKEVWGSGGRV